jgi:hypothetical protein
MDLAVRTENDTGVSKKSMREFRSAQTTENG